MSLPKITLKMKPKITLGLNLPSGQFRGQSTISGYQLFQNDLLSQNSPVSLSEMILRWQTLTTEERHKWKKNADSKSVGITT
jgi:hypothetical protein